MKNKKKKQLTDWQVLEKMCEQDKDIRAFRHILGIEMKGRKGKEYSQLKIQIDPETHHEIAEMILGRASQKKKIIVCYVIDREQFDEIKGS